jgi:hypothetical protein
MAINNTSSDLAVELQKIYDSEINVKIGWLWDGGIEIRLGDDMNGYLAEETVGTVAEIVPWLQEAIAHFYPGSCYARSLSPELRERALPAAEDGRPGDLPALWRAPCDAYRADVVHYPLGRFIESQTRGQRFRNSQGHDHFSRTKGGLPVADEEFAQRNGPRSVRTNHANCRIERQQQGRAVAHWRRGGEISAKGRPVTNERRGEEREPIADRGRRGNPALLYFGYRQAGADLDCAAGLGKNLQLRKAFHTDEHRPAAASQIGLYSEVRSAGDELRFGVGAEQGQASGQRCGAFETSARAGG